MHNKKTNLIIWLLFLLYVCFVPGCGNNSSDTSSQTAGTELDNTIIERVGQMRIFFGHQSVGANILDGIAALQKNTNKNRITITSTREAEQISGSGLYHAWIGENGSPQKKIEDFRKLIESGIGDKVDIALMKFCFIDFNQHTNINKIFESYRDTITKLQQAYPNVIFVPTTTPLIANNMTLKDWIKKILGRSQKNDSDNIARNEFNNYLRNYYLGKDPILDIAEFESTYPDGKRHFFHSNDKEYEALIADYTDDGGHLNTIGSQNVAKKVLTFISTLAAK